MRTRLNPFRRRPQEAPREYHASATIDIGADCKGDSTRLKAAALERINAQFPWADSFQGKECRCEFRWNENLNCFITTKSMHLIGKGQLVAFENYVRKLCEELKGVNDFHVHVFDVSGVVSFSKHVMRAAWSK